MKRLVQFLQRAIAVSSVASILFSLGAEEGRRLQEPEMTAEGSYQFYFDNARPSETYPVAVSGDLRSWTLLTNTGGRGRVQFTKKEASHHQQRFYRLGVPPKPVTDMVFLPPGTFTMGSPDSEPGRSSNEGPQTMVTLTRGFWIGKYEVSQAEYVEVMGTNISFFTQNLRMPVDLATWFQATNYCHELTERERAAGRLPAGYRYRLPTEAEWEYACRAGTTTPVAVGSGTSLSSTQANFDGTFPYGGAPSGPYANMPRPVGSYAPNAWGLYDMHGNVWEWCQDWFGPYPGGQVTNPQGAQTGTARVQRGGGFTSVGQGCRSAKRDSRSPTYANTIQGFRVVLAAYSAAQ